MSVALPVPLTRFIGRERERKEVARLARSERFVTLTGAGGVGKTRLALEAATGLHDCFGDGVWLVELATVTDAGLMLPSVAGALGLHEEPGPPLLERLIAHLAERQLLLLMDNCEHLIDHCAELVHSVLRSCPKVHVLATSREPLGVAGETAWRVPSLALPWPGQATSAAVVLRSEAVQLFADRAAAARPGFTITDDNASAVARVCFSLDGIPLALELAAARLRVLSVEQIAARLEERFRLLTSGSRMAPRRHQTLRATFDWSYDLLTPDERVLFRRLAAFSGGWSLSASEGICGRSLLEADVLDLLERLVDRSLVVAEEIDAEVRYQFPETLRLYAEERLDESGELLEVRNHHLACYLALAEQGERELWGGGLATWSRRLEREHDNFRAALRWSLDSDQPEDALRLASALGRFWALHGHLTEGQQWLDETLSRATTSHATPQLRARALNASGGLARDRGAYPQALAQLAECVALLRALAGPRGLALALSNLAVAAQLAGEHARASAALEESLALFRQSDDRQGIASALMTLGVIRRQRGEHNQAQDALQEALIAFRELGDKRGMAASLNNLGNLANAQNNLGAAREHYEQSLALLRELGDMREVAASQLNLAIVARDQHDLAHSVALARQSLTVLIELGDNGAGAACVEIMAGIAADTGAPEAAARLYGAAAALAQSAGAQLPIMNPGDYTTRVAALRVRLGADQYQRARASGQALGPREAAALALASSSEAEPGDQADADGVRLTRREREVAALLARGVTNREIAQALVITPGTAALHVEHLRAKLGCHSRAQVAAWAVAHGLGEYVPHR